MRPIHFALLLLAAASAVADTPLPQPTIPPAQTTAAAAVKFEPITDDALRTWESGTYTYDGAGNITSIGPTINYTYDGWMRLATSAKTGSSSQTFSYDNYGNLTRIATVGALTRLPAVETASNQLDGPCPSEPNSVCLFGSYDVAGNQIGADSAFTYEFDELNMMRRLSGVARNEVYVYTAHDERIATVRLFGTTVDWQYTVRGADAKVLREFRTSPTGIEWKQDWIHAGGRQLASLRAVPGTATPATSHFHLDHLGSTRLITDPTARRLAELRFEAFGEEAPDSQPFDERLKFTGHERDDAGPNDVRDLDYMHARFYSPFTGRFLSVDPTWESADLGRPQSWNRYSYVLNNPVLSTDPDGRCPLVLDCVALGTLGKAVFVVGTTLVVGAVSEAEVNGKPIGTHVSEFILRGGGSSGEMAAEMFAQNMANHMSERYAPKDKDGNPVQLPKKDGNDIPDPKADGLPHTQLGTRTAPTKGEAPYPQSRTWDGNGQAGRRIDHTDHNDPKRHPNPHQHRIDPNGKRHGPEPVPELPPKDPEA